MTLTAFALAGLGGFNAHGAGFLKAATECTVVQDGDGDKRQVVFG
jgi:hypothetical protein